MRILVYVQDQKAQAVCKNNKKYLDGAVEIVHGNIFECKDADCIVTAGNSFGIMDGGIDWLCTMMFDHIEDRVQTSIVADPWRGELPIGSSLLLPIEDAYFRFFCYAPTMRTPKPCPGSINAYLAMRAALIACEQYNSTCNESKKIETIAVPLFCHGIGQMKALTCIRQITHAMRTFTTPTPRTWRAVCDDHDDLFGK